MRAFLTATAERAVKTFLQVLLTFITTDQTGVLTASWGKVLAAAGIAALMSVGTSVLSLPLGPDNSPSATVER